MRGLKFLGLITFGFILACAGSRSQGDTIKQSYNIGQAVTNSTWTPADVGWAIPASSNYQLSGVDTLFNDFNSDGGDGRTVTLEIYDGAPGSGGTLLRSATFIPTAGTLGGIDGLLGSANFAPVQLTAGQNYFIGFRNVANLGLNFASSGSSAGRLSYGYSDDGSYSLTAPNGYAGEKAILQLRGVDVAAVPLPNAAIAGIVLMGAMTLVRFCRRSTAAC